MKQSIDERPAVVVLGVCPTGLAVIRALGRKGIKIVGVDKDKWAVGFYSRYCQRLGAFNIDEKDESETLLRALIDYAKKKPTKPVIFATSDDFLLFLARNSETLAHHFIFPKIDEEILDAFLNKKKFYRICEQHNILIPKTFFLDEGISINDIAKDVSYPCIFKPIYTHLWDRKLKGMKAFLVNSRSGLIKYYNKIKELGLANNIMIQEVVQGPASDIYIFASYFDRNSNPIGVFTGRKIRQYPPDFGNTTLAEGLRCDEIADKAIGLLQSLRYQGLCDVEFKKDRRDNKFRIIEINPRPGRWYGLVEASGINLLEIAYADLSGDKSLLSAAHRGMEEGQKWVFWERDIVTAIKYIQNGRMNIPQYYHSVKGRHSNAIYSKDDKLPAFVYPINQFLLVMKNKRASKV